MTMQTRHDLQEFHAYLGKTLAIGRADLTPEEALDEWRILNPAPEELAASVAAVRRAISDMRAGDQGRPADEVIAEIRQRLQNSARS